MHYHSTRNPSIQYTLSDAIQAGLAPDAGLFVPNHFPSVDLSAFSASLSYDDFSAKMLAPFFEGDVLADSLEIICKHALNFSIPLRSLSATDYVLELFHGPTQSFKDVGARFLSECLMVKQQPMTIMVATSGDTGSAVASAFYQKPSVKVIILYPNGLISARQEHQITCWDDNVMALAVDGPFDDCQRLVKQAFQDKWWQQTQLSSANSINIGRLLPQMTYYAYHSLQFYHQHQEPLGFIIPSGNLGHATAAFWAKRMGFPIREIVLALNANRTVLDYVQTGDFKPRQSVSTLANAMDVGNPSNFERLRDLYPDWETFKQQVQAVSVSDEEIVKTIQEVYEHHHMIICPHTATAFFARNELSNKPWAMVATADPAKFSDIIEPIIGCDVPVGEPLRALLQRPTHKTMVAANLGAVQAVVQEVWVKW